LKTCDLKTGHCLMKLFSRIPVHSVL
jgi:hypothetical protein